LAAVYGQDVFFLLLIFANQFDSQMMAWCPPHTFLPGQNSPIAPPTANTNYDLIVVFFSQMATT
jgi:hypothetical protein